MNTPVDTSRWQLPDHTIDEFLPKRSSYCVCIPVINEGQRIGRQLTSMRDLGISERIDVLVLDGGSTDGSLDHAFLTSQGVRALLVKRGPGKLSAQLRMGYAYALLQGYEGIITVDGNNKDGVDAIPRFADELDNGWDMVQGSRYVPGGQAINTPAIRHLALSLIHAPAISLAARFRYTDTTNGFRAYSRRFLLDPRVEPFRDIFVTYELLAYLSVRGPQLGFRTKEIPVTRAYPKSEKIPTKISVVRGNWELMQILCAAVMGRYNPR